MDIVSTQLRIPASLLKQVRHEAVEMGVSGNAAILILLREALEQRKVGVRYGAEHNENSSPIS